LLNGGTMNGIDTKLRELTQLAEYYIGVPAQVEMRDILLENLRTFYNSDKSSFSDDIIQRINEFKGKCSRSIKKIPYDESPDDKIRAGSVVFHTTKYYAGVTDGTTKSPDVFENPSSLEEYRVFVKHDKVLIAAKENLKVISVSRVAKCHNRNCKNEVHAIYCDVCPSCGWFVCPKCKSCGCNYRKYN
jgi:hypothetical protein